MLPQRAASALSGSQIVTAISFLSREEREERLYQEIRSGNVPGFLRTLVPVTSSAVVGAETRSVTYFVTPEYVAVGSNEDYFLTPMTPGLAQRVADAARCTLPTGKMVDNIYAVAPLKLAPIPIPPSPEMTLVPVFAHHDSIVWLQRRSFLSTHPLGTLVGGTKKDVILSGKITSDLKPGVPRPVVIYGWHQLNGVPIQSLYNGHEETYVDYSHGIRLVQDSVEFGGMPTAITSLLQDTVLAAMLSDEGPISKPRYGIVVGEEQHGRTQRGAKDGFTR